MAHLERRSRERRPGAPGSVAVERCVKELKRQRLERELAEGYAANAALDRQICGDFSHVDASLGLA